MADEPNPTRNDGGLPPPNPIVTIVLLRDSLQFDIDCQHGNPALFLSMIRAAEEELRHAVNMARLACGRQKVVGAPGFDLSRLKFGRGKGGE